MNKNREGSMMAVHLESPFAPRRRPFSQLQNIPSPSLSDNDLNVSYGPSELTTKTMLNNSGKPCPRLFARSHHSKLSKDFDVSYSSSLDSKNLESPTVTRPRSKPFTRRQRRESGNLFNVSYCSSGGESTKTNQQVDSPLARPRPFTRSRGKENYNAFDDISYMSSSAENTSANEISSINSSLPKLFKNRNQLRIKRRSDTSFVGNESTNSGQKKLNELLDDVTYVASPTNSSVKELSFKMPRPFKMSRKKGEDETMFDISYKSSEDGITNETELSQFEKQSELFKGKKPLSNFLNDLTYMSSENESMVPCESPESTTVSDAMEVDDVQRASMATREEYFPELHISKLTNESTASSLNLSAACQIEENHLLPEEKIETERETVNSSDILDATNLPNDVSSFLLTPCRKGKITSDCESPEKEREACLSDNEAEAVTLNERQEPFFRQVEIPLSMPDVSYNSSKVEINESNSNRNHRLFANNRSAESAFISNITYNSSIEPNEVSSSNTTKTRSMSRSLSISQSDTSAEMDSIDNSIQNSSIANDENLDEMPLNTNQPDMDNIQVNNVCIPNNDVSSSNATMTRSMSRRSLNTSQLDSSVGMKSKDKSVLNSSAMSEKKRISMSTPKQFLNTSQPDIADDIEMNDTVPNDSTTNKTKSIAISMAVSSVRSNLLDSSNKMDTVDSSKLNSTLNDESVTLSKSRPFNKLHNKLEASMQCTSYIASQETPISTNKLPVAKTLFSRNSGLPDMSFSITYEESVENTHENTPEQLSSSSEESIVSSEKSTEEESSDEEEQEESKREDERETSPVDDLEKEQTIEEPEKESSCIEDNSEKEQTEDIERERSSAKDITQIEKECTDPEVINSQTIEAEINREELETSAVNSINNHQDQDNEHTSLNDVDISSSREGNFNTSVISQTDSEVCQETSISVTERTFMSSQNNITVLAEKPKCGVETLPKSLGIDDFKKSIEDKIACIRKQAIEKVENKHKFSYAESPRNPKKTNTNRKVSAIKKYPRPKLFKPAHWANKRLYDYLSKCLEYKGLNRMLEAEKVVKLLHETIQLVTHSTIYQKNAINRLKVELATQKIIVTTFDFYCFVREYLPGYFEEKVIPCVQPYTNTVWPPKDNIKESDPIIN